MNLPLGKGISMCNFMELAKKIFLTGLGAIFMTEEMIRKTISDLKIPRELASGVLDAAKKHKDDFIAALAKEVAGFLAHIKIHEEVQRALDGMDMHVEAKIHFKKKSKKS